MHHIPPLQLWVTVSHQDIYHPGPHTVPLTNVFTEKLLHLLYSPAVNPLPSSIPAQLLIWNSSLITATACSQAESQRPLQIRQSLQLHMLSPTLFYKEQRRLFGTGHGRSGHSLRHRSSVTAINYMESPNYKGNTKGGSSTNVAQIVHVL